MSDLGQTGREILNGLIMGRQLASDLAIVVEGTEDYALVNPHVDPTAPLLVEVADGKEACLEAARLAERDGHDWLRALVDRDFDRRLGASDEGLSTVVVTEHYDLQVDYVRRQKEILRDVSLDHIGPRGTNSFHARFPDCLADRLAECAAVIGNLRESFVDDPLPFTLRGLSLNGLCEAMDEGAEVEWLVEKLSARAEGNTSPEKLRSRLRSIVEEPRGWDTVCGHDLVELLFQVILAFTGKPPNREALERQVRTRVSPETFHALPAVRALKEWGESYGVAVWLEQAA